MEGVCSALVQAQNEHRGEENETLSETPDANVEISVSGIGEHRHLRLPFSTVFLPFLRKNLIQPRLCASNFGFPCRAIPFPVLDQSPIYKRDGSMYGLLKSVLIRRRGI